MFAAPNPEAIRDVEAQPQYGGQQPQPKSNMMTTTTTSGPSAPTSTMYVTQQPQTTMQQGYVPQGYPQPSYIQPGPQQQQVQGGGTQPTKTEPTFTRMAQSVDWGTHMFMVAFLSLLVMISTSQFCDALPDGSCVATRGYEVAVGTISFIVALLVAIIYWAGWFENQMAQTAVSWLFVLWWLAGVIVLTYIGDFQNTVNANGYFGTWGALFFSLFALTAVSPGFEGGVSKTLHSSIRKPIFFLLLSSLAVMGASIGPCSPSDNCTGYAAWAVVASVVSAFLAMLLFCMPETVERQLLRGLSIFFVIWWLFATGTLTLGGPFRSSGTGYFGCFVALFSSFSLLRVLYKDEKQI